jgi:hypothetical protein
MSVMSGHLLSKTVGQRIPESETWLSLLDHWCAILNQYLDRMEGDDLPQWYNERSHTGFLTAAVWKMGGIAVEEFSTSRKHNDLSEDGESSPGQCDLYFSLDNLDCVVEAKREWISGYTKQDAQRIKARLKEATIQLRTIPKTERADHGIALCWAIPWVRTNSNTEGSSLMDFAAQFLGQSNLVSVYYVDPASRRAAESRYEKNGRTYPGIILIATALNKY